MAGLSVVIPYFNHYITASGYWFYLLNFSVTILAKIVAIFALFLFCRLLLMYFLSRPLWRGRKLNLEEQEKWDKENFYPFFSIIVPARQEAEVIKKTIYSYLNINYPRNRFELVIVTDEKEKWQNLKVTTQSEVLSAIAELRIKEPDFQLKMIEVPYDFDGYLGGQRISKEVPSTKGRAINFALSKLNPQTDFCAFFDADAIAHPDSLLAVAKANNKNPSQTVFQLPVFQCRNFWSISLFSKIAALGQAFTHECVLPRLMKKIPFLGGTNLFIKKELLFKVGGFDNHSITEDLALGISLYLKTNVWPKFLALPSSEQTPATFSAYRRQRFRWALGQLKVIEYLESLMNHPLYSKTAKKLYHRIVVNGPIEWILYFILTLMSSLILISRLSQGTFMFINFKNFSLSLLSFNSLNELIYSLMALAGFPLLIYLIILRFRYRHFIEESSSRGFKKLIDYLGLIFGSLFIMPYFLFLYPWPFFWALIQKWFLGQKETVWIKTPRTKEAVSA